MCVPRDSDSEALQAMTVVIHTFELKMREKDD